MAEPSKSRPLIVSEASPVVEIFGICYAVFMASAAIGVIFLLVSAPAFVLMYGLSWDQGYYFMIANVVPYVLVCAFSTIYIAYLIGVWNQHQYIAKFKLYILLGLGGALIPIMISTLHFMNYRRSPEQYAIASETLPILQRLGANALSRAQADIGRNGEARETIGRVLAGRSSLPARLLLVDGPLGRAGCSRPDLGRLTGAICARLSPEVAGDAVVDQLRVHVDPRLQANEASVDLAGLLYTADFHCPIHRAFFDPQARRRDGVDAALLLLCLEVADRALEARIRGDRRAVERAADYPHVSFLLTLLDSSADLAGANYSVLEPVSPMAGSISVAGSLLSLAYFVLFASLVLETAAVKAAGPAKPVAEPTEWSDPTL